MSWTLRIQLTVISHFGHKMTRPILFGGVEKRNWKVLFRMKCLYLLLSVKVCVLVGLAFAYHSGKLNEWRKQQNWL